MKYTARPIRADRIDIAFIPYWFLISNERDDELLRAVPAERIGVTPRTLYRFIDEGQVPAFKFGRVIRLKKADVDTYIESCRVEPGSMSRLYPETLGGT